MKDLEICGTGVLPIAAVHALRTWELPAFLADDWRPGFLGGHLVQKRYVDFGAVLLESTREAGPLASSKYSLGSAASLPDPLDPVNPAHDLFATNGHLPTTIDVSCVYRNDLYPDFLTSDRMEILRALEPLSFIDVSPDFHPRYKATNSLSSVSLHDAANQLYDSRYSKWFLSLVESWFPGVAQKLPARFHRMIWAPLYWPETLANAQSDSLSSIQYSCIRGQFAEGLREIASAMQRRPLGTDNCSAEGVYRVNVWPESSTTLDGTSAWQVLTFKTSKDTKPVVLHDCDHSGIFRVSINLGHSGLTLAEGPISTPDWVIVERLRTLMDIWSYADQGRRCGAGDVLEFLDRRTLELRYPTLSSTADGSTVAKFGSDLLEHADVGSGSTPYSISYRALNDPPFNSINGHILLGLRLARKLKGEVVEQPQ